MHRVPDHLSFSHNIRRRFQEVDIFRRIFNDIVLKYIEFESYQEKSVLLMVHSVRLMYPRIAAMRQLR